jgi:uncharacterized protein (DUF58 family)
MHTDSHNPAVTKAPVQLNLTAAGWAVVVMIVASAFISASSRIAVGFLIPLAAAVFIDVFLSWHFLSERTVSITPSRTVAHRPDGIPLRVRTEGPERPIRVRVTFRGGVDQVFGMLDEPVTIQMPADHTGVVNYLRSDTSCTVFGLGIAHRWQTHSIPMLHWAPAPSSTRLTTPDAIDEVARLRTYVPGDRMSRVSWPITARTGQMHVRAAGEGYEDFVVVLNLGPSEGLVGEGALVESAQKHSGPFTEESLESTLELASTLVTQLLEDGHQVRLITVELDEQAHENLRYVAIDNPRLPAVLPAGAPMELAVVDRYVVDEDDLARRLARAEPATELSWPNGSWVDVSRLGVRTLP